MRVLHSSSWSTKVTSKLFIVSLIGEKNGKIDHFVQKRVPAKQSVH